jgi:hypothetical protein
MLSRFPKPHANSASGWINLGNTVPIFKHQCGLGAGSPSLITV